MKIKPEYLDAECFRGHQ